MIVLDACCGGRQFWFNKTDPRALFIDNRTVETTLCDGRAFTVSPDLIADFRALPFPDAIFKPAVFFISQPPPFSVFNDRSVPDFGPRIRSGIPFAVRVKQHCPFALVDFNIHLAVDFIGAESPMDGGHAYSFSSTSTNSPCFPDSNSQSFPATALAASIRSRSLSRRFRLIASDMSAARL
jgi:hypothetical protein